MKIQAQEAVLETALSFTFDEPQMAEMLSNGGDPIFCGF